MSFGEQENSGVEDEVDEQQQDEQGQPAESDELEEISIGEVEAPATDETEQDSSAIRKVREAHREEQKLRKSAERRAAELEAKAKPPELDAPVVGARPKLDDYDYDTEQYESALEKWHEQKNARGAYDARQRKAQDEQAQAEQQIHQAYQAKVTALRVDKTKYAAAESEVKSTLSPMQQAILLRSASPERLVYAFGQNPAKLEELAKIKDPIALAYELGRAEKSLTSTKQTKVAPPPDRPISGSGGGVDSKLERLEAEAEKSGDRSKVVAHKRLMRQNTK